MEWAPVVELGRNQGSELGVLQIERNVVRWLRFGYSFRVFTMDCDVHAAHFVRFAHSIVPSEVWVSIVCKDRIVYSYSVESGRSRIIGLPFLPETVLRCGDQGLAFTSAHGSVTNVHLLQGPEELLGAVQPSSLTSPLGIRERLLYIDEHAALVQTGETVKVYSVRLLRQHTPSSLPTSAGSAIAGGSAGSASGPGGSAGSATSGVTTTLPEAATSRRAAVLSLGRDWPQKNVGAVFSQTIDASKSSVTYLLACHDPVKRRLFVLLGADLLCHEDIAHICPCKGVLGIPGIFSSSSDGHLMFQSLFFPTHIPLQVPVPVSSAGAGTGAKMATDSVKSTNNGAGISATSHEVSGEGSLKILSLTSEPEQNWVDITTEIRRTRLLLYGTIDDVVGTCFEIAFAVLGADTGLLWLWTYLDFLRSEKSPWHAFINAMAGIEIPASLMPQILLYFHLLREELALLDGEQEPIAFLKQILLPYVTAWGPEWSAHYNSPPRPDSEFRTGSYMSPIDEVPDIYTALTEAMQNHGVVNYLGIDEARFYPTSALLLRFFSLLSAQDVDLIRRFLQSSAVVNVLPSLRPGIRMCVLEVMHYVGISVNPELTAAAEQVEPDLTALSRALFPDDLRMQEAARLLQTKGPQPNLFGVLVQVEDVPEQVLKRVQHDWGMALGSRALSAAFGQAALEFGSRHPLLWEQLGPPAIDFSGRCVETGLTVPPIYKTLESAAAADPWGVFAHGVALGLSVNRESSGVDSLWVITSARLRAASSELYAGFVLGMGLSGHLAKLEEWQFYESLVNASSMGTLAALLGVAASKRGSRDTKLTRVLSVHIRALLPEGSNGSAFVEPEVEHSALVALGLLYEGTGVSHLTEVLRRELAKPDATSVIDGLSGFGGVEDTGVDTECEAHKLAIGIALGLINCGRANLSSLLPLVLQLQDRAQHSSEIVSGATTALALSYVGSRNKLVFDTLALPLTRKAASYSAPSALFARALARHLVQWDGLGVTPEWVETQVPRELLPSDSRSKMDSLWHDNALAGVIVAVALRHTASGNRDVIKLVLRYLHTFYAHYKRLIQDLRDSGRKEGADAEFAYDDLQAARGYSQLTSALALAVAGVAAGSGDLDVLRTLRELWQVAPQASAETAEAPRNAAMIPGIGIDLGTIAQAIGWLFLGDAQWGLKTDAKSVGLLATCSFLPLIGGANLEEAKWRHLRFLWALGVERRCLYALPDATLRVRVEIRLKSGEVLPRTMPTLLPPTQTIASIAITDTAYRQLVIDSPNEFTSGVRVVAQDAPRDTLAAVLTADLNRAEDVSKPVSETTELRELLLTMPSQDISDIEERDLNVLITFSSMWPADDNTRILKRRDIEHLRMREILGNEALS